MDTLFRFTMWARNRLAVAFIGEGGPMLPLGRDYVPCIRG
jgi:hypothetical protein